MVRGAGLDQAVAHLCADAAEPCRRRGNHIKKVPQQRDSDPKTNPFVFGEMVRGAGLEPASLAAKDPKSFAFANFANRAFDRMIKYSAGRFFSISGGDFAPAAT